jgi:recombinational DNA repair ATPase RecF
MDARGQSPTYVKSISFVDFRSFTNVTIKNLTSRNLFMGANGSGKTTILVAFSPFFRLYTSGFHSL